MRPEPAVAQPPTCRSFALQGFYLRLQPHTVALLHITQQLRKMQGEGRQSMQANRVDGKEVRRGCKNAVLSVTGHAVLQTHTCCRHDRGVGKAYVAMPGLLAPSSIPYPPAQRHLRTRLPTIRTCAISSATSCRTSASSSTHRSSAFCRSAMSCWTCACPSPCPGGGGCIAGTKGQDEERKHSKV